MQYTKKPWVLITRHGFPRLEKGPFYEGFGETIIKDFDSREQAINHWLKFTGKKALTYEIPELLVSVGDANENI